MSKTSKIVLAIACLAIVGLLVYAAVSGGYLGTVPCMGCEGAECETCAGAGEVQGTLWALLPPIIAIGLALITKEVYSSLLIGIVTGGILYSQFSFLKTMDAVVNDGIIVHCMIKELGLDPSRADRHDLDASLLEFNVQSTAKAENKRLGRAVNADVRHRLEGRK